ncbi:MAG: AAA family ATPase [Candidatus Cyclonatronum sp.]|uniref:AAA family ATPase n=1 Tax=Cyclonatronum sp. TaxID=3024185 RepID=UPI0025BEF430|nr:AAA family ATPase [Cyclonatronum sp.]MCH8488189.1 AAA family ATPase [Cyclonatronum sp.]
MSRIRVKYFGPIQEGLQQNDGWLDFKKVTVFIGNQGSGKSTLAKLISSFSWIEKALVRGDYSAKWFERKNKLKNQLLTYHRLENYFKANGTGETSIRYEGDAFRISFEAGTLFIEEVKNRSYALPQIMYVPAERNFLSYIKSPKELKLVSASLQEFLTEFDKAKEEMKSLLKLPVNDTELEYDRLNETLNLKGAGYKVRLTEASSGFQSLVPLYLVSHHLAHTVRQQSKSGREPMSSEEIQRFKKGVEEIWSNESLGDEQKRIALSVLSAKFNKTAFINIVEEPEQNLYPSSQQKLLYSLLELNNMNSGNKLLLTTHSPFLINYLTLAAKAHRIKLTAQNGFVTKKINLIVPEKSAVDGDDLAIYQFNEQYGTISGLSSKYGLPSDANELNEKLDESNELFAQLLELQQENEF